MRCREWWFPSRRRFVAEEGLVNNASLASTTAIDLVSWSRFLGFARNTRHDFGANTIFSTARSAEPRDPSRDAGALASLSHDRTVLVGAWKRRALFSSTFNSCLRFSSILSVSEPVPTVPFFPISSAKLQLVPSPYCLWGAEGKELVALSCRRVRLVGESTS